MSTCSFSFSHSTSLTQGESHIPSSLSPSCFRAEPGMELGALGQSAWDILQKLQRIKTSGPFP